MDLKFFPVDLENDLATCIQFRKDTWVISYGSDEDFSIEETIQWFHSISEKNLKGFTHIWHGDEIIGQIEFKSGIETSDHKKAGYINLFYLTPDYRGSGLGQIIHDYVIDQLVKDQCVGAMLRYIPGNNRAERFYIKNGWYKAGVVDPKRGQLMRKDFNE